MALFSTSYFGSIQYYIEAYRSGEVVIEQYENYQKQSYRNRCSILTANGKIDLIVPIEKTRGEKNLIKDVKIDYSTRWQKIHERSIISAYKNSPYFEHYFDFIEPIFNTKSTFLFDMNMDVLSLTTKLIGGVIRVSKSDEFSPIGVENNDFRYTISPKNNTPQGMFKPYYQVFSDKMEFVANLSILDLLFCEGTSSLNYIVNNGK